MKAFFGKYLFLLIWVGAIVGIGGLFVYVFQLNSHLSPVSSSHPQTPAVNTPPPPPQPSIDLTLQKATSSKNKSSLTIHWQNLPGDTVALNVYRGKTGTSSSTWSLWKTITIPPGSLGDGSSQIDLGTGSTDGYSFYVQAVSGGGGGNSSSTPLWTSDVTAPGSGMPTSTPPQAPSSTDNGQSGNPPGPTSTTQTPPPAPTSTGTGGAPTPTGTPYYSPQIQISGYGSTQNDNFWVQHVDQKIQMGWQNLPPSATSIVIYRSPNQDGPWTTVLTQENPGVNGSYSIQVVDNTLGSPYYYEMNALDGQTTVATYGPVYLPPAGQ